MVKNPPALWETWVRSLGWEDPLAEGVATYSSILAWRIPWTEEPGGLQSKGFAQTQTRLKQLNMHTDMQLTQVLQLSGFSKQHTTRSPTPRSKHSLAHSQKPPPFCFLLVINFPSPKSNSSSAC